MSFRLVLSENGFSIKNQGLSPEKEKYLQSYLSKVNRYQAIGTHAGSPVYSLYQPPLATKAGHRSLLNRLARRFEGARLPATATLAVNKACQCACDHCSAVHYNHSREKELDFESLKEAFRQSVVLGATTLVLLGGEPLLRRDLEDLVASVPQDLATVILFTNGEYLTAKRCQSLKEAGLMGAFVSLDSPEEGAHDAFRHRPGLFKKALQAIHNLRDAELIAAISSHLSPSGLKENHFEKMMELGKKADAQEITFFDAIPSGRWLKSEDCLLKPADRLHIKDLVCTYRGLTDYPGVSVQSTMTSECGSAFCFAANTQFYLTATGHMCPCDFTPLSIGRFPEENIESLWKKMISTPPYDTRAKSCRMQDSAFRKRYIEPLPETGPFPYPLLSFVNGD